MQKLKSKTIASMIALFLTISMGTSFMLIPTTEAHAPAWQIPSFAFLAASPNPVGVGQRVEIVMWVDTPLPSTTTTNDIKRNDYKLTITKPDGTTDVKDWPVVYDSTGIQYYIYTPDEVGTYTFKFDYAGQIYTWSGTYQNDTYLPASSTKTLIVQEESIPEAITSYPLPMEYWTRPIEGQNTDWWKISSNWLSGPYIVGRVQPSGTAPNSPHIMWTKPIDDGGVAGGDTFNTKGETFFTGLIIQMRFANPIIMQGRLYYALPRSGSMNGGGYVCVDLRTGEEIWFNAKMGAPGSGVSIPTFGYDYSLHQENWHGVIPPGILFSSNFGSAFNPLTSENLFNVTGVPSGTEIVGTNGEILRIQLNSAGKWLAQWNSSRMWTAGIVPAINTNSTGWVDASLPSRYDWNMTLSALGPGTWSINRILFEDLALLTQGNFGIRGTWDGANMTAISLKPDSRGQLLWTKNYPAAPGNVTRSLAAVDPVNRIIVFRDKETFKFLGYSLDDGNYLWTSAVHPEASDYEFFETGAQTANGKLYFSGYGGMLYCYDTKDGAILWTYGNGGPGNSTNSGLQTPWGNYPIFVQAIVDGKLYAITTEHSPNTPLYKGARVRCIEADTGREIWTMLGYGGRHIDPPPLAVADGFLVYLNHYDMQIYCVGKGPSATTVTSPDIQVEQGTKCVIRGTVTDQSPGSKIKGSPAISDASMGEWMEYKFMQKPRPTNATGVEVSLDTIDPNNNYVHIGNVTSDTYGQFAYTFTPPIPGDYRILATFAGSESYWGSSAESFMTVSEATAAPTASTYPLVSSTPTELYFAISTIAIIIAIAIAVVYLKNDKKRL